MTNRIKTLLKTTAAVATLMAGSQSWGAALTTHDGTACLAGNTIAVVGPFESLTVDGASVGATELLGNVNLIFTQEDSHFYLDVTKGAYTFTTAAAMGDQLIVSMPRASKFHIVNNNAVTLTGSELSLAASTNKADRCQVHFDGTGAVTLPTAFTGALLDFYFNKVVTVQPTAAARLKADLVVNADTTLATYTALDGDIDGDSTKVLTYSVASGELNGNIVFAGTLKHAASVTYAKPPANALVQTTAAATVTIKGGGSLKEFKSGHASTVLTAEQDLTVGKLDLSSFSATINPGTGKKLTISLLKTDGTLLPTIGAGGTVAINDKVTLGATAWTVNSKTGVKKVTVANASSKITAGEDVTIDELEFASGMTALELAPAGGRTITVKKITGATDLAVLNLSAAGTVLFPKSWNGTVTPNAGIFSTK